MYAKLLNEVRQTADSIRSGKMSVNRQVKEEERTNSLVNKPKNNMPDLSMTDEDTSFEDLMLQTFVSLRDFEDQLPASPYNDGDDPEYTEEGQRKPKAREDWYGDTGLTEDTAFMAEVERLQDKYPGLTQSEIFRTIKGESGFNPQAQNPDSKAAGLFQFIPSTAAELGFTVDEIKTMEPAEQLRVYDSYLERWGYEGGNALGIMQAAPAYANAPPDQIVYEKGTKAWEQNPGWRGEDDEITVASINQYYRGQ